MLEKIRFDFGSGKAVDGFVKVTGNTIFSDTLGYGIEEPAAAVSRKKGSRLVARDFLLFEENIFKVRLKNGTYRIRLYSGDYEDIGDVMTFFYANGQEMKFWIHEETVVVNEIVVDITDEVLEIKAGKGKHVCLNALEIAPKLELEGVDVSVRIFAEAKNQSVTLSWDSVDGASLYRVTRKSMSNCVVDRDMIIADLEWKDCDVDLCQRYEYTVTPMDDYRFEIAKAALKEVYVTDGGAVTGEIKDLSAVSAEKSVSLKWKGFEDAVCFRIYKKPPYGLSKLIATVKECEYIDSEVVTCVPFTYKVEAVTTSGASVAEVVSDVAAEPIKPWMETLDRGLVAVKAEGGIFVSWRVNAYEYDKELGFLVYRNGERLTEKPVTECGCYLDKDGKPGDTYTVKAVKGGKAEREGASVVAAEHEYLAIPLDKPEPYTTPDGNTYEYFAGDVMPADVDGDGEYEFVIKWLANPKDNSHKGYTGVYYVDAYKMNGKKLWRINLGVNIRVGAHYAQIMVYDFDHDGKVEIICKTADGTTDSKGTVIGDANADYRNKDGFIIEGPEYLSLFDGATGELLDTVDYDPPRGNVIEWGDSWGNRVDRFLAGVAYLDGETASAVMCRGYYDIGCPTNLVAYDVIDKKLVKRWKFLADKDHNIEFTAQGNHHLAVGDVDGDGKDEIVYGSMAVDHDGTGMYSTRLGHGDYMHLGKFMPHSEKLDYFQIHEEFEAEYGYEVHNPATGEILWGKNTGRDTGRGMCAKIDPRYVGNQVWAIGEELYTFDGKLITENVPKTCKFTVWWDGDLLRELLDYKRDADNPHNGRPLVYKWDWENEKLDTIFSPGDAKAIRETNGTPSLQADILGDWREELLFTNDDSTELRIYTATTPTEHRFYTLMHDHLYRLSIAWQNTAYNMPPHTGFYIGPEMEEPPVPKSKYVRGENIPEFTEEIEE